MKAHKLASAALANIGMEMLANNAPLVTATIAQTMVKLATNANPPLLSAPISAAVSSATPNIVAVVLKAVPSTVLSVCRITVTRP